MANTNMVIDTNIFIDYLRAKNKVSTILYSIAIDTDIFISAVTLYELYMGATTEEKKKDIQLLTEDLVVLPFNNEVAIQAAVIFHELKRINQMIEFRDIFIAATCLVYKYPIKTTNLQHFNRIKGLKII